MRATLSFMALAALLSTPLTAYALAQPSSAPMQRLAIVENATPGVTGLPGTQAGPTLTPNGQVIGTKQMVDARLRDLAGVHGQPDTQSGTAIRPG
jgi:hypothetical protein